MLRVVDARADHVEHTLAGIGASTRMEILKRDQGHRRTERRRAVVTLTTPPREHAFDRARQLLRLPLARKYFRARAPCGRRRSKRDHEPAET